MKLFLHNLYVLLGAVAIVFVGILVIGLLLFLLFYIMVPNPLVGLAAGIILLSILEAIELTRRGERL